ncbi:hypothetical protein OWV82_012752 [Melia azedarach]|uniref:Uncharacterized protein n=1 Tax=Melia azedarach TaxID=155640 RepID=A0ACC1XS53_MELAZ|nr:hypothetical protein OWV82_012752 [Melia azedarach]
MSNNMPQSVQRALHNFIYGHDQFPQYPEFNIAQAQSSQPSFYNYAHSHNHNHNHTPQFPASHSAQSSHHNFCNCVYNDHQTHQFPVSNMAQSSHHSAYNHVCTDHQIHQFPVSNMAQSSQHSSYDYVHSDHQIHQFPVSNMAQSSQHSSYDYVHSDHQIHQFPVSNMVQSSHQAPYNYVYSHDHIHSFPVSNVVQPSHQSVHNYVYSHDRINQLPIYNMAQAQSPHPSLHNYNFVYGQDQIPQLPIYNMAQAQSSHQSFPNFGYGPDQIPHFPMSNTTAQPNFYNFVHGQAQFPQNGSENNPIDVDDLSDDDLPKSTNNFDLNLLPEDSPSLPPSPAEDDEVHEVIEISDDDEFEYDNYSSQVIFQNEEPPAGNWLDQYSSIHDWGGIAPFIPHQAAMPSPGPFNHVPLLLTIPSNLAHESLNPVPTSYTSRPHQRSAQSSTMAQFVTEETTSDYGVEVSSILKPLNLNNVDFVE